MSKEKFERPRTWARDRRQHHHGVGNAGTRELAETSRLVVEQFRSDAVGQHGARKTTAFDAA